ncbi:hypothetical protein G6F56_008156 [Rhizopus delemar]|nr:hypothetical protein G6F56_008156 [Rhizopus delemar]
MVGQLLMCGFDGLEPTQGILDLIRHHHLGSIILFSRNIQSPEQVQRLTHTLQTAAKESGHDRPLFIAVDQENGVVRRLGTSATYLPGSMALGAIGSNQEAQKVAQSTAIELLSLGIQWNLAPVLDVNNNPLNPVIGVRSFGENPNRVAQLGTAQVEGYQAQGVAACVKHFPGHGDTATDSHLGVPVIDKELETELVPFRHAFASSGNAYPASVMIAHMALPRLIPEGQVASLSSQIIRDLLRGELNYQGLVITDCLEMDAVKETVGSAHGAVMALEAGNDIAMLCHTLDYQRQAIRLIEQMDPALLKNSFERVAAMKDRFLNWKDALEVKDLELFGSHGKQSERLYDQVPTIVRDIEHQLPIRPTPSDRILFLATHVPLTLAIDSEPEPFNSMYASLRRRHPMTEYIVFGINDYQQHLAKIQEADYVIVGTANANLHPFQSELVKLAHLHAQRLIVVAVINPYDLMVFSEIKTYLVTFEYTPPAHEAFVRLLFGEIEHFPKRLPISLPPALEEYKAQDLESVYALWQAVFVEWPLSLNRFSCVLKSFRSVLVRDQERMIGFAAVNAGELGLLMVHPDYRKRGIGSALHDWCLGQLKDQREIRIGATYPRFFCGVPEEQVEAERFFKGRGYIFGNKVWDLMGDLSGYEVPIEIEERMKREGIVFELTNDVEQLLAFEKKYFECWLETFRHHAALGDLQDFLVARNKQQEIVASLILYTAQGSHEARTDLIWTDERLFGAKSGGMACVGVADHARGKGIGLGIVAHANKILKERGVNKSCVDWVEAVDFYRCTGYQTWRSYSLVEKINS